jgi:hypothetical protein
MPKIPSYICMIPFSKYVSQWRKRVAEVIRPQLHYTTSQQLQILLFQGEFMM